jgi:hypothetical protein
MPGRKPRRAKATVESPDPSIHDMRQGANLAGMSEQLGEKRLEEEEKKEGLTRYSKVTLKNGAGLMGIGEARNVEASLRDLLDRYPDHFRAFHAIVEGHGGEVSKELRGELKRWNLLQSDGSPNSVFKTVMIAGCRETPDGPAIVDPVELRTRDDVAPLQRFADQAEKQYSKRLTRLLRKLNEEDKDEGKGRLS